MKKHDEGYALVLVLVVIVVLGLIAGTLMSFSLSNLQSQTASIERMKAKYEAAGKIEMVVAQIENPTEDKTLKDICDEADVTHSAEKLEDKILKVVLHSKGIENKQEVEIDCELKLTSETVIEGTDQNYTIHNPKVEYKSYQISTSTTPTDPPNSSETTETDTSEGGGS